MSVTMAMIVGRYGEKSLERCAQITCKSVKIAPSEAGAIYGMHGYFNAVLAHAHYIVA
jgi:hypothetical protein